MQSIADGYVCSTGLHLEFVIQPSACVVLAALTFDASVFQDENKPLNGDAGEDAYWR